MHDSSRSLILAGLALVGVLEMGCSSSDPGQVVTDGGVLWDAFDTWGPAQDYGKPDLFGPRPDGLPTPPDFGTPSPDATSPAARIEPFGPVSLPGCAEAWKATTTTVTGEVCGAHLQAVQLGVGDGPEPDTYGCRVQPSGGPVEGYLYEKDCDDSGIALQCSGVCGDRSVLDHGSVKLDGASACNDGWKPTGVNIGAGKQCRAFVGEVRIGVGSGPEPDSFGCRYNESSGAIEAYLYEKGCDDDEIELRCDWLCWEGIASTGLKQLKGGQCNSAWTTVDSSLGAGRKCVAGIGRMLIGVGSGPEPSYFGCRYNSAKGTLEAYFYEKGCDDLGIELDCGYVCFD